MCGSLSTSGLSSMAVVDTSFWSICCRLNIASRLTQVWLPPVLMPGVVLTEVFRAPDHSSPRPSWALPSWPVYSFALYPDQIGFLEAFAADDLTRQSISEPDEGVRSGRARRH